jgi:hypothetical protein
MHCKQKNSYVAVEINQVCNCSSTCNGGKIKYGLPVYDMDVFHALLCNKLTCSHLFLQCTLHTGEYMVPKLTKVLGVYNDLLWVSFV